MRFERMAVRVRPGEGTVGRFPRVAVAVLGSGSGPDRMVDELLAIVRSAAEGEGPPGRRLARRLAGWLAASEPDDVPPFCTLAEAETGLAVVVHGDVDVAVRGPAGDELLSGAGVASWVDRIIAWPEQLVVAPTGQTPRPPAAAERSDLRAGVVPGGGLTLAALDAPPDAAPEVATAHRPSPAPAPPPPAGSEPGFRSVPLGDGKPRDPRPPLPLAGPSLQTPPPPAPAVVVQGVVCSRGHFNDPAARYCSACGISMVHRTLDLVSGTRPPIGVLVLDDGATFTVDGDYVAGREPAADPAVGAGQARPLVIDDPGRTISRVHAAIVIDGWVLTIVDRGSANGTFVAADGGWVRLAPDQAEVITPGTRVRLGDRELLFESHHHQG